MADPVTGADLTASAPNALDRLRAREELLEICFWYQGEGFGSKFTPQLVQPFLSTDINTITHAFEELVSDGYLVLESGAYILTVVGKRRGGRMFSESFVEFQQPGHGECQDGCCDGDEPCVHNGGVLRTDQPPLPVCGFEHVPGKPCNHPAFFRMRYRNS